MVRANRNRKFVDSPLEGNGFELSVPRCPADSVGAFIRRQVGSSSRRNRSIGFAEADDWPLVPSDRAGFVRFTF